MMTVKHGECPFLGHAIRNNWQVELNHCICKACDDALDRAHCMNSCMDGSEATA